MSQFYPIHFDKTNLLKLSYFQSCCLSVCKSNILKRFILKCYFSCFTSLMYDAYRYLLLQFIHSMITQRVPAHFKNNFWALHIIFQIWRLFFNVQSLSLCSTFQVCIGISMLKRLFVKFSEVLIFISLLQNSKADQSLCVWT